MNKDTVVGILGAVILVAAMVGIFYYEGTQAPGGIAGGGGPGTGGATFQEVAADGPTAQSAGALAEGSSEDATLSITRNNLTRAEFVLTWTDDTANSGPDRFRLTVTSPSNVSLSSEGDSGTVSVVFSPINAVPTNAGAAPATNGTGTWSVTVEMLDAGDVGPATPVPIPGLTDGGNAWSLATRLTSYEP